MHYHPILFDSALEKIDKEINVTVGFALGQTTVGCLAYAQMTYPFVGNNVEEVKSKRDS